MAPRPFVVALPAIVLPRRAPLVPLSRIAAIPQRRLLRLCRPPLGVARVIIICVQCTVRRICQTVIVCVILLVQRSDPRQRPDAENDFAHYLF